MEKTPDKFAGRKPRNAAAVILLNSSLEKILLAQRNPALRFLGGFHGYAGGKVDRDDEFCEVRNSGYREMATLIACAAREVFEEVGVLLVRNGEKLTAGQRASLHDDLISGRFSFAEILKMWGLWLDAEDFKYTGYWTTPEFSPIRFKTHFFIAVCPRKQKPFAAITELQNIEFIKPADALRKWSESAVLIVPPVLFPLQIFAAQSAKLDPDDAASELLAKAKRFGGDLDYIELNARLVCLPLKTKTLPPATHTNCFIVGKREFAVIDAASRERSEQDKLFRLTDEYYQRGFVCREIIVSHLHPDHFGGETALQNHLTEKSECRVPIAAHRQTVESLKGKVEIDRVIEDDEIIQLKDEDGNTFGLKALHTPGHARGHLCFYDEELGFLLTSDNVVGLGSVLIAPPEGNMIDYLQSLDRMRNLPGLNFLCGSHGSAVADGRGKISEYIAHRLERERAILSALEAGAESPAEIVKIVYTDVAESLWPLAEKSVEAHLEKIQEGNLC